MAHELKIYLFILFYVHCITPSILGKGVAAFFAEGMGGMSAAQQSPIGKFKNMFWPSWP